MLDAIYADPLAPQIPSAPREYAPAQLTDLTSGKPSPAGHFPQNKSGNSAIRNLASESRDPISDLATEI